MNLDTFVERLKTYDMQRDKSKIIADLRQLATNRSLLSNHLYATIQQHGFVPRNSLYHAYAFVLHSNNLFTLRLGFWSPVQTQDESETFIYNLNHNHDFEMYAVGYSGEGYTTLIREILDDLPLQAGKTPRLGKERILKLAPGEVLYMPALREIHKQIAPHSMSASLSLLIHPEHPTKTDEAWCFDNNYTPLYPGIATQEVALFNDTLSLLNPEQSFSAR
ncbi:transposase [Pseudomonas fluorescens]|uniref:Transposase n=1 Tax=Pseudomonas fluorescens TaxID=294 RepID=A0A944DJ99_PSEFL|nr:transposase [Pseudomonas fluorescens]MBT2295986.1 transposase [Pseudomonas fluorescens]MBT2308371.1 transposase [Pseudomonas fluorescens]MBT2313582.1 transposase [Pseudomonas fluorescens]MBT2320197.1 transposase [Pseudomonas fluorescens]MBT2329609.1 transposase [Pseudomonas fluorescens]